jgi:N-carbamoyl-L-amino-acid hydrolase
VVWCKQAGLAVTVDAVGNIFGRRAGLHDELPPVLIGKPSRYSGYNGGRFDGIAGVLSGLEVVRTLRTTIPALTMKGCRRRDFEHKR